MKLHHQLNSASQYKFNLTVREWQHVCVWTHSTIMWSKATSAACKHPREKTATIIMHASCISQWFINFNLLPTHESAHWRTRTLSHTHKHTRAQAHTIIISYDISNCSLVAARRYMVKTETGCSKSGLPLQRSNYGSYFSPFKLIQAVNKDLHLKLFEKYEGHK